MSEPLVVAVCVTADRPALLAQAVRCFKSQTYANKSLAVMDSGVTFSPITGEDAAYHSWCPELHGKPMAIIRNKLNEAIDADIIVHLDDDDWSHENRIAEQVALLRSSGAAVVGYDRMLFWRECLSLQSSGAPDIHLRVTREAWIYTGSILGTSLVFWRKVWERTPFLANGHHSEDLGFVISVKEKGGKVLAVDSIPAVELEPRMIARIHAGNASNPSYGTLETHPHNWQRAPHWDRYCAAKMEGK